MMYQKSWRIVLLVLTIGIGAGCAPKPHVDIYMLPVTGQEGAMVDTPKGAVTVEQNGVQITLEPLDEVELYEMTKDFRINPYVSVNRQGNVDPLYTVFELRVHNADNKRVVVEDLAILIDDAGEQRASLPYAYFQELYTNVGPRTVVYRDIGYRYYYPYPRSYYRSPYRYYYGYRPFRYYPHRYFYPSYRAYNVYPDENHLRNSRMVVRQTVFDGGKLFPGAKRDGLLVFDRIDAGVGDVKVIIPEVLVIDKDGNQSKVDFKFDFRQVVAVKE